MQQTRVAMSTTDKGNELEDSIYDLFSRMIDEGRFFARRECCQIFKKKRYYSEARKAEIEFDVAIEMTLPGESTPSLRYLIECKNYSGTVPVGDVEEFLMKVEQVAQANSKAIFATKSALQAGAFEFARSKGIGVVRYFGDDKMKWDLARSASDWFAEPRSPEHGFEIEQGLLKEDFSSDFFDFYCHAPEKYTNSINTFFSKFSTYDADPDLLKVLARIDNPKKSSRPIVPYLSAEEIELSAPTKPVRSWDTPTDA